MKPYCKVLPKGKLREVCVPCRWVWCGGGVWRLGPMTAETAVHWVCIQIHAHSKGRQKEEHRGWEPQGGLTLTGDQSLSPELHSDHQAILNKVCVTHSESSSL